MEAMGPEALTEAMVGLLLDAQEIGKGGFSDRSMVVRMMGQPWATGSAQGGASKTAALDMGTRLAAALNRAERQLARLRDGRAVVDVEPDGLDAVTPEAQVIVDLGF